MAKVKEKATEIKEKAKEKAKIVGTAFKEMLNNHPDTIIPVVTATVGIIGGIITGVGTLCGTSSNCKESCLVEDDITNLKFHTKHPLCNSEILELGERMSDGQSKGNALNDMGVLKKEKKRR